MPPGAPGVCVPAQGTGGSHPPEAPPSFPGRDRQESAGQERPPASLEEGGMRSLAGTSLVALAVASLDVDISIKLMRLNRCFRIVLFVT